MVQRWVVNHRSPKTAGFLLYLVNAQDGQDRLITPEDQENGDPVEMCREYFGTYANPGDFLVEPARTYQMMRPERGV